MTSNPLKHYTELWKLSDPQLLAETFTSQIYTVSYQGERVVLKLLTPLGVQDEHRGAIALHHWDGFGTVCLLRDDEQAHLLEYASGEDLIPMVQRGDDDRATAIIADLLHQLHMKPAATSKPLPEGLTPLTIWFRALFDKAQADREAGQNSIYVRAARKAEEYLANPLDTRVLHGDIHHENIRYRPQRGWLLFDPKGLIGERTFDAANVLRNPHNMPELVEDEARMLKTAATLARALRVETARVLDFTYLLACLSACWYLQDGEDPQFDLRIARIVEPHLQGW